MKKVFLAVIASLACTSVMAQSSPSSDGEVIKRGGYIAAASNCIACHTMDSTKPFAGGVPFGIAFSANITPDKETGIGNYSYEDFERALRQGINKNGEALTVMMPPSYSMMTDGDLRDLYAYMLNGVTPVKLANQKVGAPKLDAVPRAVTPFAPQPGEDPVVARGRYLADALGHCGFCHSPRDANGLEMALTDDADRFYLSGGAPYNGWIPINLRGDNQDGLARRSENDLTQLLLTGRNDYASVFGGMTGIITHSTQYLTQDDAIAMARYIKTLAPKDPAKLPFKVDTTVAQELWAGNDSRVGAALYVDSCATCHKTDGKGYPRFFPELQGNPVVLGNDATSLIHIVLAGQTLPGIGSAPSSMTMPAFGWRMNDQEVADVVNFIRSSWGNNASPVSAADVKKLRENTAIVSDPRQLGSPKISDL